MATPGSTRLPVAAKGAVSSAAAALGVPAVYMASEDQAGSSNEMRGALEG
jgi:hypothetical protein